MAGLGRSHGEGSGNPHSSALTWKIPWTEEPDRLQTMASQRVGHDWATSLSFHLPPNTFSWSFSFHNPILNFQVLTFIFWFSFHNILYLFRDVTLPQISLIKVIENSFSFLFPKLFIFIMEYPPLIYLYLLLMPETFFPQMSDDHFLFIFKSESGLVMWQIGSETASHEDSNIRGRSPCFGGIGLNPPTGDVPLAASLLLGNWLFHVP